MFCFRKKKPEINFKGFRDHIYTLVTQSEWLIQSWECVKDAEFRIREMFNYDKNDK